MKVALEVGDAAESHVIAALRGLRFSLVLADGGGHGPAAISAWKGKQRILVQVNAAVSPAKLRPFTPDEEQSLRHQAAQAGAQAWEAQVILNRDLGLIDLQWRPLELGGFPMGKRYLNGSGRSES